MPGGERVTECLSNQQPLLEAADRIREEQGSNESCVSLDPLPVATLGNLSPLQGPHRSTCNNRLVRLPQPLAARAAASLPGQSGQTWALLGSSVCPAGK